MLIYGRRNVQSVSIQVLLFANQQELVQMPYARHNQVGLQLSHVRRFVCPELSRDTYWSLLSRLQNAQYGDNLFYYQKWTNKKIKEASRVEINEYWFALILLQDSRVFWIASWASRLLSVGLRKPRTERNRKFFLLPFL